MTQEQIYTSNNPAQEKDHIVAWLWLWDREEEYDYQREVWKTLGLGPSVPNHSDKSTKIIRDSLTFDWAIPISQHDAIKLLGQSGTSFVDSLFSQFGIASIEPTIGLPKGPYYDPVDVSAIRQGLEKALDELARREANASQAVVDPLQSQINEAICFIRESIVERVRNEFGNDPDIFFKLAPSEFSRLVAELLRSTGADVYAIQENADSGANILAYQTLPLTSQKIMTVVECKQPQKDENIGPQQIQQFFFIAREQYRATQAMYVTATHFTPQAKYWEDQYKWFLQLRDYDTLCEWLNQYGQWEKSPAGGIWIPEDYQLRNPEISFNGISGEQISGNAQSLLARPSIIRILFLATNPLNTAQLRLDEEFRSIDQALRQSEFRSRFDMKQQWAVRVDDLQEYLLRHKPNIVHFSGHGSSSSEIVLEDNLGNSYPVPTFALAELFSILNHKITCVVLNACYSEGQAKEIAKYVDYVVGMSKEIGDKSAIAFSTAFYRALGYGENIETAFKFGRSQINLSRLGDQAVPKLISMK